MNFIYPQGAVVYPDMKTLLKMSESIPVGMLAFVADQEFVYLRVKRGWRYIQVSQILWFLFLFIYYPYSTIKLQKHIATKNNYQYKFQNQFHPSGFLNFGTSCLEHPATDLYSQ